MSDEKAAPSTAVEDKFFPAPKPDVTADPSPASSETPPLKDEGAVQTEAAPEPADQDPEPDPKSKSPRSSWAEMRQARYKAEARAELLEQQLAERNKAAPLPAPAPAAPPIDPSKPTLAKFTEQIGTAYDTWEAAHDAFLDARESWVKADWDKAQTEKQRQVEQEKAAATAKTESAAHLKRFEAREKIVQAQSPNYTAHFNAFFLTAEAYPVLGTAVYESDLSPDLADHLGAHPEELARIAKLAPGAIWKEIGKLEVQLAAKGSPPLITNAPRPSSKVNGVAAAIPKDQPIEDRFYKT